MKKRIFLPIILAAVMLASVLAGCGSSGSAEPKEEPAATTGSVQTEEAPAETKAEDAAVETENAAAATSAAAETESIAAAATAAAAESTVAAATAAETESTVAAATAAEAESTVAAATAAAAESTVAAATAAEAESTVAATSAAAEESAGLANPWSHVESADEAAAGAGIDSFVIAENPGIDLGENYRRTYRCMDGIAEAYLEYPASALTVRKGTLAEEGDISGDYTDYANTWTQDVNGIEVTCFGNREGDASKSIWTVGDMCFSIVAEGLGGDEDFGLNADRLTEMVNSIQ